MNKEQEVLTLCPKAISFWGEHPLFHQPLGLAGLAEVVTALVSGSFVRNYFRSLQIVAFPK